MTPQAPPLPSLSEFTRACLKIGFLGFGGPAGQIALMHRIFVEERGWIDDRRFLTALNACMLLPGPEAQQLATYVGWRLHGVKGGLIAGTLFVLPGFALISLLAAVYALYGRLAPVEAIFFGLKAAVLAIVVDALRKIARRALGNGQAVMVAAAAFVAIYALAVPFPLVVLGAAILGAAGFVGAPPPAAASLAASMATPPPQGIGQSLLTALLWAAVWAALPTLLIVLFGPASVYGDLARFFSLMAVVTFGGAYAALAYVGDAAVNLYGWLGPGEMLDALATAETTPGPLLLVLVFVGFLAGFRSPLGIDPLSAGLLAGTLVAWVTFVPSLLWIFVGAPWLERLLANDRLRAALAAVTAAVVGVILNLTIWFALHVLFARVERVEAGPFRLSLPDPYSLDVTALVFAVGAFLLLFGLRAGMITTLAVAALAGLALHVLPMMAG